MDKNKVLQGLGFNLSNWQSGGLSVISPIDGSELGRVNKHSPADVEAMIDKAVQSFKKWRVVPPPQRGELVRLFGEELRAHKDLLGTLITMETGKILEEGRGEVQEMIDICDFAVGLSRQLYGLTIASERPQHRLMETWHPIGPIGVISPFNFPLAVWCWNFALAIGCGDSVLWKPSEKTPLSAFAALKLFERAVARFSHAPSDLLQIIIGGRDPVLMLTASPQIPVISATGSTGMGKAVAQAVGQRLGRTILELSGNNGMILTPSADLELATQAIAFAALGTTGQRCTSLRRLIVHSSLYETMIERLQKVYERIAIGNPLEQGTLMGPLIDKASFETMERALTNAKAQGGKVFGGGRILQDAYPDAYYVRPALVQIPIQTAIVREETFAPILYVMPYENFEQAIELQNDVSQGLSSCIFTNRMNEAEMFLSPSGSDCGIANVNIGPSGAEIGGAFGGEKETGGGRESGSDAWKNYMRRATNTINYSSDMPLAQGIHFDVRQI
ncbi:MAG: aldehyde dehydrogenase family protein [Alphaproteobacteria bacterium]|nr:aldehyde dehydrogenase family protein [Alphaproteobacteria bacterium]